MKECFSEEIKILLDNSVTKEIEKNFINSWFEQRRLKKIKEKKEYENGY